MQVFVTENVADEMVERHFQQNLQVATQILDEVRLRSRGQAAKACQLGEEVFGNHGPEEESVAPIERNDAISKQEWTDAVFQIHYV